MQTFNNLSIDIKDRKILINTNFSNYSFSKSSYTNRLLEDVYYCIVIKNNKIIEDVVKIYEKKSELIALDVNNIEHSIDINRNELILKSIMEHESYSFLKKVLGNLDA